MHYMKWIHYGMFFEKIMEFMNIWVFSTFVKNLFRISTKNVSISVSSVVWRETISAEILTLSLGNLKLSWMESAVLILFFVNTTLEFYNLLWTQNNLIIRKPIKLQLKTCLPVRATLHYIHLKCRLSHLNRVSELINMRSKTFHFGHFWHWHLNFGWNVFIF